MHKRRKKKGCRLFLPFVNHPVHRLRKRFSSDNEEIICQNDKRIKVKKGIIAGLFRFYDESWAIKPVRNSIDTLMCVIKFGDFLEQTDLCSRRTATKKRKCTISRNQIGGKKNGNYQTSKTKQ